MNLNLEKDEEMLSKVKQAGWNEKATGFWRDERRRSKISSVQSSLCSKCMMEGVMTLAAEWFPFEEDQGAARCLRADVCLGQRIGQYKDFLTDLDDQVWRDQSADWQQYLSEKRRTSRLVNQRCVQKGARINTANFRLKLR